MDRSQEIENQLLPQGDFGPPRDRRSGEPDAAVSTSSEGTVGVASVSAPTEQAATTETNRKDVSDKSPSMDTRRTSTQNIREKRKASSSPDSEIVGMTSSATHRPTKARIIASTESPEIPEIKEDDDEYRSPANNVAGGHTHHIISEDELDESDESLPMRRVTRASTKFELGKEATNRFGPLKASRIKKSARYVKDEQEKYFDNLVERTLRITSEMDKSDEVSSEAKRESDSTRKSNHSSLSKKKIYKRKVYRTNKSPTQRGSSRRTILPVYVTKEDAEKELNYTREDWLRMDPAKLGGRCLEHLSELEQQRARCTNISGRVACRMKESRQIAAEITKAMIEKLTVVGDIFSLKNENHSLRKELNEIKRREQAQAGEIDSLRNLVTTLEREVRSLKEGFGFFPALKTTSKKPSPPLNKKKEKRKGGDTTPAYGS